MAPFRHRQIFYIPTGGCWSFGDAEEDADSLPWTDRNNSFYDQRYAQPPTIEPLSEDMVRLVRSQLTSIFYERIAYGFLCTQQFQLGWCQGGMMRCFNQPCLPPEFFIASSRHVRDHLMEYADVHVAVYFSSLDGIYRGFEDRKLGRYIFRKWFHWHDGRPPFLGHQTLAKAIGLKGDESRDIQGIWKFHRSLCDAVSVGLNQQELPESSLPMNRSVLSPYPKGRGKNTDQHREISHLFRAIVIIADDQVMQHKEPDICRPILPPESKERDALAHIEKKRDWAVSQYSVLLFKTGDDAHLSSPVSFQPLYDSGKAFPVKRPDCNGSSSVDGIDVVRVKLDTALEFVLNLIRREREAIPYLELAAEMDDRQHLEACEKWVDIVTAHARKVGIDTNGFTWEAVRRAKAALNGEAFHGYQISPPWDHLGSTSLPMCL
ncbi:hypothetical protein F4680DRAFT_294604 [Xylaria scruposa]|nr:hypothetical protein F4680DRAFT_294604 [Xylaria scruposa]